VIVFISALLHGAQPELASEQQGNEKNSMNSRCHKKGIKKALTPRLLTALSGTLPERAGRARR
jgi:hypothetical protein